MPSDTESDDCHQYSSDVCEFFLALNLGTKISIMSSNASSVSHQVTNVGEIFAWLSVRRKEDGEGCVFLRRYSEGLKPKDVLLQRERYDVRFETM